MTIMQDRAADSTPQQIPVVDLDSDDARTLLKDAAALGIDLTESVIEDLEYAIDSAREEQANKEQVAREKSRRRAASRRKRPWWQTEPCPEWCACPHSDDEPWGQRYHRGAKRIVAHLYGDLLVRKDGSRRSLKDGLENKPCVRAWVSAHIKDATPRIVIADADGDKYHLIDLTPEEAMQRGATLIDLASSVSP